MANRYWVGGSGTWSTSSTTNWSTTSGGTGGASVPTSADNVFFDQAGTYTVTMSGALNCLDFTVSAGTVTFVSGTGPSIIIYGSMTLLAGTVWTTTAGITFGSSAAGRTVTTNGVTISGPVTFAGTGGWSLGSALTIANTFTITNGTFNTTASNYNITCTFFSGGTSSVCTLTLNGSTITTSGSTVNFTNPSLTLNSGTSQINCTSSAVAFNSSKEHYAVAFTSNGGGTVSVSGTAKFNSFSVEATASAGVRSVTFQASITTAALTVTNGAPNRRVFFRSNTLGTARTITFSSAGAATSYADFRDITAGTNSLDATTSGGDCGGNTNITFPAAKIVYWNLAGSQDWGNDGWASTSGGVPSTANFPLAQDTAVFNNAGAAGTIAISRSWNVGSLDMSNRSNAMSFSFPSGIVLAVYGSWYNGSGNSFSGSAATINFAKRGGIQSLSGNGRTFTQIITITAISCVVQLNSSFTTSSTSGVTLTNGALDLQSYTLTTPMFVSNTTATRSISFNGGNITITGSATAWDTNVITGFSINGTSKVNVSYTGSVATAIAPGPLSESNAINFNFTAGTYTLTMPANSSWGSLDFTGFSGTVANSAQTLYGNLILAPTMTLSTGANVWSFSSTAGVETITCNGTVITFPITFIGNGGTWQLQDAMTVSATRTVTLTRGTLDLNGNTLTTGFFASNNSNTRTIAFGTGNITLNGAGGTLWNTSTSTGLTTTGTQVVNVSYSGAVATTITPGTISEANSISFNFTTGTYALSFTGTYRDLNFTGFTGSISNNAVRTVYGNLTFSSGMAMGAGASGLNATTFAATSGTKTITSNGQILPFPLTFNGIGGTWQLQDALTLSAIAGRGVTLVTGTLNTNGYAVTADFLSTSLTTLSRTLTLGTSTVTLTGTGTPLNLFPSTSWPSLTVSAASSTINFTSASAKVAIVADKTWGTINQGGTGTLTFTGTLCTIGNLTNTVQPATVLFQSGNVFNFLNFNLSGTSGNQITIGSATAGTQHTLSKSGGTVNVSYCTIANSNATGGATWNAFTSNGNVDGGNNTGWIFSGSSPITSNFLLFFNGP